MTDKPSKLSQLFSLGDRFQRACARVTAVPSVEAVREFYTVKKELHLLHLEVSERAQKRVHEIRMKRYSVRSFKP